MLTDLLFPTAAEKRTKKCSRNTTAKLGKWKEKEVIKTYISRYILIFAGKLDNTYTIRVAIMQEDVNKMRNFP